MARSLRCSICGATLEGPAGRCTTCGADNAAGSALTWMKRCPRCRHTGYGEHYFSKMQHIGLLVVLSVLTSGVGGLVYWLMRFQHRICPRCGLNWRHASHRAVPGRDGSPELGAGDEAVTPYEDSPPSFFAPPEDRAPQGWLRVGGGSLLGFMGLSWLSGGAMILQTGVAGLSIMVLLMLAGGTAAVSGGAALIWSGIKRLRWRKGSPDQLERGVLRLASQRGGRLTTSEVAAYMDLPIDAAKKLLDDMEIRDSQRVCSEVTDEGVIVYEFPELLRRPKRRLGGPDKAESDWT